MVLRVTPAAFKPSKNLVTQIGTIARATRIGACDGTTGSEKHNPCSHGRRNQPNFHHHIVTIEDPIEFITDRKSLINQREVGSDTLNLATPYGLALPNVILVVVTVKITECSEIGHLV